MVPRRTAQEQRATYQSSTAPQNTTRRKPLPLAEIRTRTATAGHLDGEQITRPTPYHTRTRIRTGTRLRLRTRTRDTHGNTSRNRNRNTGPTIQSTYYPIPHAHLHIYIPYPQAGSQAIRQSGNLESLIYVIFVITDLNERTSAASPFLVPVPARVPSITILVYFYYYYQRGWLSQLHLFPAHRPTPCRPSIRTI